MKNPKGKMDTVNTHLHERSLFWLGSGTSIKLIIWA